MKTILLMEFAGKQSLLNESLESHSFIHQEVYEPKYEQAQELSQVFIAIKQFYQNYQKEELGTVSHTESNPKKQHLLPSVTFPVRKKYPILAPDEIVRLGKDISRNVRCQVVYIQ